MVLLAVLVVLFGVSNLVLLRRLMSSATQGLQDLNAAVAAQTAQSALVVSDFAALNAQIANLQNQTGEVTDAQLETLAQTLQSAQANVAAALAPAPAPAPTPAP